MSKNIAISDEVYEKLKREKADRSFSEVIEEKLETSSRIADVTGAGIFNSETYKEVTDDVAQLSQGTVSRLEEPSDEVDR